MAEQKREDFRIHLHVYDEEIEVVLSDRTEEEYYRAAAKLITDRYNICLLYTSPSPRDA